MNQRNKNESNLRSIQRIITSLQWTGQEFNSHIKKIKLTWEINTSCLLSDREKDILRNRLV